MRSRLRLAFLIAVASSLVFVASASACQITNLVLDQSAGPGDTVSYSISGIEPGASYSFTIAGLTVSGTNTSGNGGVGGTFTMPDLGSQQQTLTAYGQCSCPDGPPPGLVASMQYLPAPPAAPPAGTNAPAASALPAARRSSPHSQRPASPASPVAVGHHAVKDQPGSAPSVGAGIGAAPAGPVGSRSDSGQSSSASDSARHSTSESSSVPDRVLHTLGSTTDVGPAKVPTMGLLLFALIFIAGTALAAFLVYLSQTGLDPEAAIKAPAPVPLDPAEAELQEMIGDEMARQLLSDLELGERTTAGSA
jgi:hypothetical protein